METNWYKEHNCDHAHCPRDCEKPQPSLIGNRLLCMKCYILEGIESEMAPCTPATCD